jgi:hypothetical protein
LEAIGSHHVGQVVFGSAAITVDLCAMAAGQVLDEPFMSTVPEVIEVRRR